MRPEGLEPPAYWFEANRSIQLSYGRGSGIVISWYHRAGSRMLGFVTGWGSLLNDSLADGVEHDVGGGVQIQLLHETAAVRFNGV